MSHIRDLRGGRMREAFRASWVGLFAVALLMPASTPTTIRRTPCQQDLLALAELTKAAASHVRAAESAAEALRETRRFDYIGDVLESLSDAGKVLEFKIPELIASARDECP